MKRLILIVLAGVIGWYEAKYHLPAINHALGYLHMHPVSFSEAWIGISVISALLVLSGAGVFFFFFW